jgi:hypothetical protein
MPNNHPRGTDPLAFQKSIGEEFNVIKNRVRDLIGDQHWGEEGRYKESLLKNTLKKFLPENMGIGTGFILKKKDSAVYRSSQIDIFIYDTSFPVLLKEGDFVITSPEHVYAIIEVKTNIDTKTIDELKVKRDKNFEVMEKDIFYGIFVFDDKTINKDNIREKLRILLDYSKGRINHICVGSRLFVRYFSREELQQKGAFFNENSLGYWGFYNFKEEIIGDKPIDLEGLAPAYFISNLVDFILIKQKQNIAAENRSWFLFPIVKGKQPHQIGTIELTEPL